MAIDIFSVLRRQTLLSFSQIVTGDEFWFLYLYQSDYMFARSRDEVIPRTKATIGAQNVMLTIFVGGVKLVSINALPAGARVTQEHLINSILFDIVNERGRIVQRVRPGDFCVNRDNSMRHNDRKVTDEFDNLKLDRVLHRHYSPYLSPCDF
jgi:hypothetical protein